MLLYLLCKPSGIRKGGMPGFGCLGSVIGWAL